VGKNVAVFVDVANIFYAAKAAGTDIDYVTLLKAATAGRDFVRAYAYTGLDPDNENQRNFHAFLARNQYKVVSKDIRKYGDGKVKANLDIELVVDMMKTARNLDIAIVVSGDGDFAPAIRAVQEMGVRVEVISFRGNTSSDLIDVADLFTDITQLARVDKSSSRSGRRVAVDDEDLSMTEVPDKQTEGTGARGRGRGRGRGRPGEPEPVAAGSRRGGRTSSAPAVAAAASANGGGSMTVMPGEKLSRAAAAASAGLPADIDEEEIETLATPPYPDGDGEAEADGEGEAGRRRRRRRGGRGRGRGRGREDGAFAEPGQAGGEDRIPEDRIPEDRIPEDEEEAEEIAAAPRGPRTTPFGSFWDSQLGVPSASTAPSRPVGPVGEDEDFDEPEIPEYLIAEQRRGRQQQQGQGRGGQRGGRGARRAYTAAIERERYGTGGRSGGMSGGINRYPDVSGRDRQGGGRGQSGGGGGRDSGYPRQDRPERVERPARTGGDPWSEVPPELEEMLRAQLAQTGKARPASPDRSSSTGAVSPVEAAPASDALADTAEAPKRRTTRKPAPKATAAAPGSDGVAAEASGTTAPKRRTTRKPATTAAASTDVAEATAPKPRATRSTAKAKAAPAGDGEAPAATPKPRAPRKKADPA